jgi:arylsulfatase A-like enzyme
MPTVVHWPSVIKPGTEIDTPLAFWDLMPTFCELAETTPSGPTDGLSFVPALKGNLKDQHTHDYLYWEFNEKTGPMQALRFMNYKAIRTWNLKANTIGPIQLYDLSADKQERTNLAAAKPEVVQQAHKFFASARTEHPKWPLTPRPWIKKTGKK